MDEFTWGVKESHVNLVRNHTEGVLLEGGHTLFLVFPVIDSYHSISFESGRMYVLYHTFSVHSGVLEVWCAHAGHSIVSRGTWYQYLD